MKIIVSSKVFAERLEKAFEVGSHVIQYFANEGAIVFGTTAYQSDVTLYVEKQYPTQSETIVFNNLGMAKLLIFLKTLSEQPVTITLAEEIIRVEYAIIEFF